MLQNEQTTEQQPPAPTGQNRVTPDELNRALAALEARKQAEAQHLAGTIPIEEAVTQLHLDATPDEIWAEVQSQRNRTSADEARTFAEADAARRAHLAQAHPLSKGRPGLQAQVSDASRSLDRNARVSCRPRSGRAGNRRSTTSSSLTSASSTGSPTPLPRRTYTAVLWPKSQAGTEVYADDAALAQVSAGKPLAQSHRQRERDRQPLEARQTR